MALSNWEKQRNSKNFTTWTNQSPDKRDELVEVGKMESRWRMIKTIGQDITIEKYFLTKSKATSYAKSYMRTH